MNEDLEVQSEETEESSVYFPVGNDYYISSDPFNYILSKSYISKGKIAYRPVGYYNQLDHLYRSLINKELMADPGLLKNISAITELINDRAEKIKSFSVSARKLSGRLNSEEE